MTVVGEAATGAQAAAMALRCGSGCGGDRFGHAGRQRSRSDEGDCRPRPRPRVLVLTMRRQYPKRSICCRCSRRALQATSSKALQTGGELVDAIHAVAHGDVYVQQSAGRVLVHGLTRKDPAKADRERYEGLSAREREMYCGSPLRAIRRQRSVPSSPSAGRRSTPTDKQRINGTRSRPPRGYVRFAVRLGLLTGSAAVQIPDPRR